MAYEGNVVNYRPGELTFYSDEEEEPIDDFVFGVPSLDNYTKENKINSNFEVKEDQEGNVIGERSNVTDAAPTNRGGFGVPAGYSPRHRAGGIPDGFATVQQKSEKVVRNNNPTPSKTELEKKQHPHTKMTSTGSKPIPLEDFKTAVVRGNMEELQKYLDQGVPVNEVLRTGWTALMYAGNYANVKAVSFLLERGADPTYHTDHYSVLMAVCASTRNDHQALCDCAKLLIDHGANVNHYDRYHMTPLMYAARDNKPLLVQLLIDADADKDKQDNRGYTALAWAACRGHVRVVHVLMEAGASPEKACGDGSRPADLALTNGHNNIASILRRFSKGETTDSLSNLSAMAKEEKVESEEEEQDITDSNQCNQYGALEMFLLDAELGSLITTFQQNQITFEAFLRLTDSDLQQLGIKQLGVRKKLLDSISATHKQEWLPTSLPSIQYNRLVTCPESVAMVVNLSRHAAYMATSAGYIGDQIKSHPEIVTESKDGMMVIDLCNKTEEALGKVRVLYKELEMLRKIIAKETSQQNFEAPDLIKAPNVSKKKHLRRRRIALVGFATVIGLVIWKRESLIYPLMDSISGLVKQ